MKTKEIYEKYKRTELYNDACAVICANSVLLYSRDAEHLINMEELRNSIIEVMHDMIIFIVETEDKDDTEDVLKVAYKLIDSVDYNDYQNIFYKTEQGKTFIDDVIKALFNRLAIYIDLAVLYKKSDKITSIDIYDDAPPIIDYKTVMLTVDTPATLSELRELQGLLGTAVETETHQYTTYIRGLYHHKHSWSWITNRIKEE